MHIFYISLTSKFFHESSQNTPHVQKIMARRYGGSRYRRRISKRRRFRKYGRNYKVAKRAAWSVVKRASETKYTTTSLPNVRITTSGDFNVLEFKPNQGNGKNQRVGNRVRLMKIVFSFHFDPPTNGNSEMVRLLVGKMRDASYMSLSNIPSYLGATDTDKNKPFLDKSMPMTLDRGPRKVFYTLKWKKGKICTWEPGSTGNPQNWRYYYAEVSSRLNNADAFTNFPYLTGGYYRCYYKDL